MYKTIRLQKEIQDDAIRFGNEANLARAIPYIRDGLKPSQRYTIYTAFNHGYSSNKPHIKSLKLDGQIVGEA
jgi:DNA gyrase subunit A